MLTKKEFWTVIFSVLLSLITAHVILNIRIKRFLDLMDNQNKIFLSEIKKTTIENINKNNRSKSK